MKKRILIDARVGIGLGGGVETLVRGLAKGYSKDLNKDFEVVFLVNAGGSALIKDQDPNNNLKIIESSIEYNPRTRWHKARSLLRLASYFFRLPIPMKLLMPRDLISEGISPSLIHYTYQATYFSNVPIVFHPHDLQHKYFPDHFSRLARIFRDANYSMMCRQASLVAVSSEWVKRDLTKFYSIPEEKIRVVPLAPLIDSGPISNLASEPSDVKLASTTSTYLFYPAVNWPHKNHLNLFLAVKKCIDEGINVRLVCTGRILDRFVNPNKIALSLGLSHNIVTLGHVSNQLLDFLYLNSRAVVIPTKFEAASFPIYEAQVRGKAVACSSVTSLLEQVGDSAILFDPEDVDQISQAIRDLWRNDGLVRKLELLSRKNILNSSWSITCQEFVSLYSEILNVKISSKS